AAKTLGGLGAKAPEAAAFHAQQIAFRARQRLEIQLAAQGGGGRRQGVGAPARADQAGIARLEKADHERAVGLVQRQTVLQQQDTPVHRIALDARAADVQARLVQAAEEFLDDQARLVVQGILQRDQAAFL